MLTGGRLWDKYGMIKVVAWVLEERWRSGGAAGCRVVCCSWCGRLRLVLVAAAVLQLADVRPFERERRLVDGGAVRGRGCRRVYVGACGAEGSRYCMGV